MNTPLTPEDVLRLRFVREGRLSPDGTSLVYSLWWTPDSGDTDVVVLRIVDLASGQEQQICDGSSADYPRWSPDGKHIAYVATRDSESTLVILKVADGTRIIVTTPRETLQGAPAWSPDGKSIAVVSSSRRAEQAVTRRITTRSFRADGMGFIDGYTQRLCLIDVVTGRVSTLVDSLGFYSNLEWDARSERLMFLATQSPIPFAGYSAALYSVRVSDGAVEKLLGEDWYLSAAKWLPDGRRIVVIGARCSSLTVPTTDLWIVDPQKQTTDCRSAELEGRVGFRIHHDMPIWDTMGLNGLEIRDENSAWVTVQNGGSAEIFEISLTGAAGYHRVAGGERACIVLNASADRTRLAFLVTDLLTPPEIHLLEGPNERRVTEVNREVMAGWPEPKIAPFNFRSADGVPVEGWFLSGLVKTSPLPTILFIHGGPFSATGHAFRYDLHMLASHGFGVAFANFRGSFGYGEAFARAIMGDWGTRGYPDHMGAVDRVIELGWADPERVGVWGPSHGGFATCWLVTHSNRFKAAVAEAASTSFASIYHLSDAPDTFVRELGGRPHEIPDVYRSRSPLTYAHRCKTPMLFIHGEHDYRCPISEVEQFHRVLLDVGCESEILVLRNASHIADSMGPPAIRVAQNSALLDWFERKL